MGIDQIYYIYIYTWNPNDPSFGWLTFNFMGQNLQNKGHSGSRYIIYIYIMFAGNEHSELPAISNSWLSGV